MFAVVFEVKTKPECRDDYLREAGLLRPELEKIDGFISNERFADLAREGWVLSLSIWRDEKALIRWRTLPRHHQAQVAGRSGIFADYHLRVGEIVADSSRPIGETAPQQRLNETEIGVAKYAVLSQARLQDAGEAASAAEISARLGAPAGAETGLVGSGAFRHLLRPDEFLLLTCWTARSHAEAWAGGSAAGAPRRVVRIIRDYGMSDRREAPQYYPPVAITGAG